MKKLMTVLLALALLVPAYAFAGEGSCCNNPACKCSAADCAEGKCSCTADCCKDGCKSACCKDGKAKCPVMSKDKKGCPCAAKSAEVK